MRSFGLVLVATLFLGPATDEPQFPTCVLYRDEVSLDKRRYCADRSADGSTVISRDGDLIARLSTTPCGLSNVIGNSVVVNLWDQGLALHIGELPASPADLELLGRSGRSISWSVLSDGVRQVFIAATPVEEVPRLVIDGQAAPERGHCRGVVDG